MGESNVTTTRFIPLAERVIDDRRHPSMASSVLCHLLVLLVASAHAYELSPAYPFVMTVTDPPELAGSVNFGPPIFG